LKRKLTAYPVLRLYDPAVETEVHTDACARGLGAILLQRQCDKSCTPTAYFSRPTNETESRYHSYELEMLAVVKRLVHADHFGPLQQIKLKYKYILVVIDAFIRFVWFYATKATNSRETIKNLSLILLILHQKL